MTVLGSLVGAALIVGGGISLLLLVNALSAFFSDYRRERTSVLAWYKLAVAMCAIAITALFIEIVIVATG